MKRLQLTDQSFQWVTPLSQWWRRLLRGLSLSRLQKLKLRLLSYLKGYLPEHIPIATKLAFTFTLLLGSGMILIGLMLGTNQSQLLHRQMQQFGTTLTHQMAESMKEPLLANDTLGLELVLNSLAKQPDVLGTAALSDEGNTVVANGLVPPHNILRSSGIDRGHNRDTNIEWQSLVGPYAGTELVTFVEPVRYQDLTVGYALITFDRSMLNEARRDTITTVIVTIILMLIISIAVSMVLAQRLTRPIDDLMIMSRAIQEGNYHVRVGERRNDELGALMDSMNDMSHGLLRKTQVEQVFSRYVSPQVAMRVLNDLEKMEHVSLGGRHVNASVIFADIVGFTSLSEKLGPQESSNLLNIYFSHIAQAVNFCHGHVDKYMGDCAMVVFGVPEERDDHSVLALSAAWMILKLVDALNEQRRREGKVTVEFRIGINSGQMIAGNMGSAQRMDYTVVGDAVNLASRLSHAGDPSEVILLEEMLAIPQIDHHFTFVKHGTIRLRGKEDPVATVKLADILLDTRYRMLDEITRILHMMQDEAAA